MKRGMRWFVFETQEANLASGKDRGSLQRALRLDESALVGERYVPTREEAHARAEQELAALLSTHRFIDVQPLTQAEDLDHILSANAYLIEGSDVAEATQENVALLKDLVQDWGDVYAVVPHATRRTACLQVLDTINDIEREGYFGRWAAYRTDDAFTIGVIMLVPTSDWHRASQKQALVRRRFTQYNVNI